MKQESSFFNVPEQKKILLSLSEQLEYRFSTATASFDACYRTYIWLLTDICIRAMVYQDRILGWNNEKVLAWMQKTLQFFRQTCAFPESNTIEELNYQYQFLYTRGQFLYTTPHQHSQRYALRAFLSLFLEKEKKNDWLASPVLATHGLTMTVRLLARTSIYLKMKSPNFLLIDNQHEWVRNRMDFLFDCLQAIGERMFSLIGNEQNPLEPPPGAALFFGIPDKEKRVLRFSMERDIK